MLGLRIRHTALLLSIFWLAEVGSAAGQISIYDEIAAGPDIGLPAFLRGALTPVPRPTPGSEAPLYLPWRPGPPVAPFPDVPLSLYRSGVAAERALPGIKLNAWSGPAIGSTGLQAGVIVNLRF